MSTGSEPHGVRRPRADDGADELPAAKRQRTEGPTLGAADTVDGADASKGIELSDEQQKIIDQVCDLAIHSDFFTALSSRSC
jgi:hypothetical protein